VVIIDKETVLDAPRFLKVLQQARVTVLESVPSLMTAFLDTFTQGAGNTLSSLRWMIPTGEALTMALVQDWFRHFPHIPMVNAYGPTEASDDVTHHILTAPPADSRQGIPIGKPLQNLHIYVLDKHLGLCPVGVRGEICVAGIGVGKGYWQNPEKTAAAFVANPFLPEIGGDGDYAVLYKTGDIGYYRPDGVIECLGRIDHQVKIRGNRIELGEIESLLKKHETVKDAVVTALEDSMGSKFLCAYIVPFDHTLFETERLKTFITQFLPDYMVPQVFITLEALPLNSSGKIDRKRLPAPEMQAGIREYTPPANPVEETLQQIWEEVLGIKDRHISMNDDFFALGGHSLSAARAISRINRVLDVHIPLIEIFQQKSLRSLAAFIMKTGKMIPQVDNEKLVLLRKGESGQNLFLIHDGSGDVEAYNQWCRQLGDTYNYWGIRVHTGQRDQYHPRNISIPGLAVEYLGIIKSVQPQGPYRLGGWSLGGTIVFEIVRQMEQQGEQVEFCALIDTPPPNVEIAGDEKEFTLVSEVKWLDERLAGQNLKAKLAEARDLKHLWDILVHIQVDAPAIRALLPADLAEGIPNLEQLAVKEIIYYFNLLRTLDQARNNYIPAGKIAVPVHFFAAQSGPLEQAEVWNMYLEKPLQYYPVQGDHFSIFASPYVSAFAEKFQEVLGNESCRKENRK